MANEVAKVTQKYLTTDVLQSIMTKGANGEIQFPPNYSVQNAVTSAALMLNDMKDKNNKPILEVCTKDSIASAVLDMVVQGLNPMKNQGYFIPYGNKLSFQRSYLGTIAITKRIPGVMDVKGYPLYKNDVFKLKLDLTTGGQMIEEFTPASEHKESELIGAFAIIIGHKGILHVEKMDMDQIKKSWNQGQMKGQSPAHKNFPDQMAIKTVINRACKMYADTADDTGYVSQLFNRVTDKEVEEEIKANANTEVLDVPEVEYETIDEVTGEIVGENSVPDEDLPDFMK